MNVACSQCSAKYAINDDRVKGRKVRIKCKRCGNSFVVDGTAETTGASGAAPAVRSATPNPGAVAAVTSDPASHNLWMVAITDDDTREMTTDQVIEAYASRTIDQYTYLWREGMVDWQAPFEIAEIAALLKARGFQVAEDALPPPGAGAGGVVWREPGRASSPLNPALPDYQDDESDNDVTRTISRSTLEGLEPSDKAQPLQESANDPATNIENAQGLAPPLATSEPFFGSPARAKVSDRPSGVDLFGGFPKNPEPEPQAASTTTEDSTLTGARHESSVLFSLNALVSSEEAKTVKRASRKEVPSDDAFLSSAAGPPSDPIATLSASVDPMLAVSAPSLPPPSTPSVAPVLPISTSASAPRQNATSGLLLTLLGFVIAAGGIFAVIALDLIPGVTVTRTVSAPPPPPPIAPDPTATASVAASAPAVPSAVPSAPVAVASAVIPSATALPSAAPAASASAALKVKPAESSAAAPPTAPAPAPTAPTGATATAAAAPAAPTAATPAPTDTAAAAPAPAPAPAAGGFNTDAAKAALASAAANATANCKVPGTPAGSSKVTITFVPSGKATQALVAGDFAGTPAGSCIARVFRGAQVPAFSGDSVTVTKSVTLR
jgi:predicted Zn finger-like uncharacterized protein